MAKTARLGFWDSINRLLRVLGGADTSSPPVLPPGSTEQEVLESRRAYLRRRIDGRRRQRLGIVALGLLISAIGVFIVFASPSDLAFGAIFVFYGALFLAGALMQPGSAALELDVLDIEGQLDLLTYDKDQQEVRAERLFKLHQRELNKYYEITLRQSRLVLYVGVGTIIVGFLIIALGLYYISVQLSGSGVNDKLVVAGLAAIGSILANFVAAIYLAMYGGAVRSLTEFHSRLVVTHHLHYGSFLAAKISDTAMRNRTLASMAVIAAGSPEQTKVVGLASSGGKRSSTSSSASSKREA